MPVLSVEDEQNRPTVIRRDDYTPAPTLTSSGSRQDPKDRRTERMVIVSHPSRTKLGNWVEVPIKSGYWKGFTVTLRVEITKINGKCSVCMTRLTAYLFSIPGGFLSWRVCFKCLKPEERECIKILYPTLNLKDIK